LHIGPRFLGREELASFKLFEGPLDLFVNQLLRILQPLSLEMEHFQCPRYDLIGVLVRARAQSLGDQQLMLWAKRYGHRRPLRVLSQLIPLCFRR